MQLVDGFEKFGDASGGPLQVGDRGVVVDIQRGPNGERYVLIISVTSPYHIYLQTLRSCPPQWPKVVVSTSSGSVGTIGSDRLTECLVLAESTSGPWI